MGLGSWAGQSGVHIPVGEREVSSPTAFELAVEFTHPFIQWVPRLFCVEWAAGAWSWPLTSIYLGGQ